MIKECALWWSSGGARYIRQIPALLYSTSKVASGGHSKQVSTNLQNLRKRGRLRVQDLKIITMADAQVSFMLLILGITVSHRSA